MRERKTAWLHVRLTPTQQAALRQLAAEHGGNVSRAFTSLLNETNRGPQEPPSLAGMRKTKSLVTSGQDSHQAFQG